MRFLLPALLVVVLDAATLKHNHATPFSPRIKDSNEKCLEKLPTTTHTTEQAVETDRENHNKDHLSKEEESCKKEQTDTASQVPESDMLWWESDTLTALDLEPFAGGSFGAVYHACLNRNNTNYNIVVKTVKIKGRTKKERDEEIKAVMREFELQSRIDSKWVVKMVHGMWKDNSPRVGREAALLMEFGGDFTLLDLYDLSRSGHVQDGKEDRFERVRYFSAQIAMGLTACHQHGILHRDVALKNVLVSATGEVKLCDFGLSCKLDEKGEAEGSSGTFCYASRKIFLRQKYGVDADYYSLGACMYALDTMTEPLEGVANTVEEIMKWHEDKKPMYRLLDAEVTDWRVVDAVYHLCDLHDGTDESVTQLQLFRKCTLAVPPQCIMIDIQNFLADAAACSEDAAAEEEH